MYVFIDFSQGSNGRYINKGNINLTSLSTIFPYEI